MEWMINLVALLGQSYGRSEWCFVAIFNVYCCTLINAFRLCLIWMALQKCMEICTQNGQKSWHSFACCLNQLLEFRLLHDTWHRATNVHTMRKTATFAVKNLILQPKKVYLWRWNEVHLSFANNGIPVKQTALAAAAITSITEPYIMLHSLHSSFGINGLTPFSNTTRSFKVSST